MPRSLIPPHIPLALLLASTLLAPAFGQQPQGNPVPQLMKNLDSDNVQVAAAAARSLGAIFAPGGKTAEDPQPVIAKLIERLGSSLGGDLRREAARALGEIRANSAIDPLKKAMDDEDVQVAMAAGEAIAKTAPVDEARTYLIERGSDESEAVKVGAYFALAPIAKPEDSKFLAAGLQVNNWRVQKAAVEGLERTVRAGAELDPATYDAIAAVLGNEIVNASNAAMVMLSNVRNQECIRATVAAADKRGEGGKDDVTWRTRAAALRTLDRMGWPTLGDVLPVVIRNLGDPIANVQNAARNIIYRSEKEHFLSFDDLYPKLVAEFETAEPLWMRAGIMREMRGRVPQQFASRVAKRAAATLTAALEEKSEWPARAYSVQLLGESGTTASIEEIAQCVADDVPNVRQNAGKALETLSSLCPPEKKAVVPPILMPLLEKPSDWRKTSVAARTAGYYPAEESVAPLIKLLSHSVINVKEGAADALAQMVRADEAYKPLIQKPLYATLQANSHAWEYGPRVVGALNDAQAIDLLIPILEKGNWRAKTSASLAVAEIGANTRLENKVLSDTLIKTAQSNVLQVQEAANKALRTLVQK